MLDFLTIAEKDHIGEDVADFALYIRRVLFEQDEYFFEEFFLTEKLIDLYFSTGSDVWQRPAYLSADEGFLVVQKLFKSVKDTVIK